MKHLLALLILFQFSAQAQTPFDDITIKTIKITDNIYMLKGAGGNIGLSVGKDEVFIIDDQFAPLSNKIIATIKKLSDKPFKFLVNTHHHGDHTGGNANMANQGATIIAHNNVRHRLKTTPNRQGKFSPEAALPIITFNDKINIFVNGEQVLVFHAENAHTDGDALLYFTNSNVLHTGDTYFNDKYPFIDIKSGGSVNGYINAFKNALLVIDENTAIIPGHGDLSNKADYENYLNVLTTLKKRILEAIKNGKTEDEVASDTSITKPFDDLGMGDGFINSKNIRRTFYKSLKQNH